MKKACKCLGKLSWSYKYIILYKFYVFLLKKVQLKMNVTQLVDQVPISFASFPSDIMVSLTKLVPWNLLMKISHGVLPLLIITAIMYQVEVIMEIVDPNVHCLVGQLERERFIINLKYASILWDITAVIEHK